MAVLQKIRNRGVLLVSAIAIALFLFVIGDLLRGGEGLINQSRQTVGEINGESVGVQDFQNLYEDMQNYQRIAQQKSSFSEEESNQIKDMAWQSYVQEQLISKECKALGLTVTDDEVAEIIRNGASQMLQVPIFTNQQGRYDYSIVQQFLAEYKNLKDNGQQVPETYESIYKYYIFVQKQIRSQFLASKYQNLLGHLILSNPVSAKQNFDARQQESSILLASVPFSSVKDEDVKVSDQELKDKYNAEKEKYRQYVETRDAKIIDVSIVASDKDRKALEDEMQKAYADLAAAATNDAAGNVTRQNTSLVPYTNLLKGKDAFPQMIQNVLGGDSASLAVGSTTQPKYDALTNTYYSVKLLEKATQADSVLFRQLLVTGKDQADIKAKADSIVNALNAGAKFKEVAKKYGQAGDSAWIATAQYQQAQMDADNISFVQKLYSMQPGENQKLTFTNGNTVVLQVMKQTNPIVKYNVAALVKELRFSDETYNTEYNKFSSFIAANPSLQQIEANAAKAGYTVRPVESVTASLHNIARIHDTSDAVKWLFDEAKEGDISQLYECGDNDHLLLVALTGVTNEGYAPFDKVKDLLKQQVTDEKKAEKILADASKVKDMNAAKKLKGVVVDSVNHVSFANPAFVRATMSSEPIVSGLASKTAKGQFAGPAKGQNGVFMLQVLDKTKSSTKYDEKAQLLQDQQADMRMIAQNIMNDLYMKANVKDQRYKFF